MMVHPSDKILRHLVSLTNAGHNIDITVPAIANARQLFGPDLGGVKWKTVGRKPGPVRLEYVATLWDIHGK